VKNKIQLITYINRIGCKNINEFRDLINTDLKGLFGGVHILPFFYPYDGEDTGFDPINHKEIDSRLGNWKDINLLSKDIDIMADLIVNHISAKSYEFKNFIEKGKKSKYSDLFLTYDSVFPKGASKKELSMIYRPRPGNPFTRFNFKDGTQKKIWTTFTSNQIDINVNSKPGIRYLEKIIDIFHQYGIKIIRLDAVGYSIKKRKTNCFMINETFDFIEQLTEKAKKKSIKVLVEVHSHYKTQIKIAKKVDYIYDFALPVLVLDTIFNKNSENLKKWLQISPRNIFTVLDTHDGIGIMDVSSEEDMPGLIDDQKLHKIINKIHKNTNNQSIKATGDSAQNLDLYQINCTYFDALARDETAYLIARAIQFFIPGIPQIYYVGFLAGTNDMSLLKSTNVGRDINRHYYSKSEIKKCLKKPFIKNLIKLMKDRNSHKAFEGEFHLIPSSSNIFNVRWVNNNHEAELFINLDKLKMRVKFSK